MHFVTRFFKRRLHDLKFSLRSVVRFACRAELEVFGAKLLLQGLQLGIKRILPHLRRGSEGKQQKRDPCQKVYSARFERQSYAQYSQIAEENTDSEIMGLKAMPLQC